MILKDLFINIKQLRKSSKFLPEGAFFFDIETTGLSPARSHLYLIGCAFSVMENGEKKWKLRQFFLDAPSCEEDLLHALSDCMLEHAKVLIHYNGSSFDIPYLSKKYSFYDIPNPFSRFSPTETIDLYRTLRPYQKLLHTDGMKQKDIEKAMGLTRKDEFSGKELIDVYESYLGNRSEKLLDTLLLHNAEDVTNMLPIYSLTGLSSFFSGDYEVTEAVYRSDPGLFHFSIQTSYDAPLPIHLEDAYSSFSWEGCSASLDIRSFRGKLKHFFPDYKNYYYLPEEDEAIHKSVGAFVDPEFRVRAKAENCYQKAEGIFLPQPKNRIRPSFRKSFHDEMEYFQIKKNDGYRLPFGDQSSLSIYVTDFLNRLIFHK